MAKVHNDAFKAFYNRKEFSRGNTAVHTNDSQALLRYYGNLLAVGEHGKITVNMGGYFTRTTVAHLQPMFAHHGLILGLVGGKPYAKDKTTGNSWSWDGLETTMEDLKKSLNGQLKLLSVEAWREPEGWTWNNWYEVDTLPQDCLTWSTRKLLAELRSRGWLSEASKGGVTVEDDYYNMIILDSSNRRPLYAIEYGCVEGLK